MADGRESPICSPNISPIEEKVKVAAALALRKLGLVEKLKGVMAKKEHGKTTEEVDQEGGVGEVDHQNDQAHSNTLTQLAVSPEGFLGFVQKYNFSWGSCRNITAPSYCIPAFLCRAILGVVQKYQFLEKYSPLKRSAPECPVEGGGGGPITM